jgi:hypothetical protein
MHVFVHICPQRQAYGANPSISPTMIMQNLKQVSRSAGMFFKLIDEKTAVETNLNVAS